MKGGSMDPHGPLGRGIKPFAESAFRDWVRSASNQGWFRRILTVDTDAEGSAYLYVGGREGGAKFPLKEGIAGLTAAAGLAHVTVPGSPFITWLINEMIDEVGPALRDAYREGRTPTGEELREAQSAVKESLKTKVRVLRYGDPSDPRSVEYYIHHFDCFANHVMQSKVYNEGESDEYTVYSETKKKGLVTTLGAALSMGAQPTHYCEMCMEQLGILVTSAQALQEDNVAPKKPVTLKTAQVLMLLEPEERTIIKGYLMRWRRQEPETAPAEIKRLMRELDLLEEGKWLATATNLEEFKFMMRDTLDEKNFASTTAAAFADLKKGLGFGEKKMKPGQRYETAGEYMARKNRVDQKQRSGNFLVIFWPWGIPFKGVLTRFGGFILNIFTRNGGRS